ncbi:MAG: PIN domain-containing protein [Paenibacillaceae bacterium]
MRTPTVWIDTNIIIRFITSDHLIMTPETALLMKQAEDGLIILKVASMVIAECCWVLQSPHYQFSPSDIAGVLTSFITARGIEVDEKDVIIHALDRYSTNHVDFIDAYLAEHVKAVGSEPIITYNTKDFQKLNVTFCSPAQLSSELLAKKEPPHK